MASESIVPHVVPEIGGLEWPRFCYAGKSFSQSQSQIVYNLRRDVLFSHDLT